jgi:hypothetical protein
MFTHLSNAAPANAIESATLEMNAVPCHFREW